MDKRMVFVREVAPPSRWHSENVTPIWDGQTGRVIALEVLRTASLEEIASVLERSDRGPVGGIMGGEFADGVKKQRFVVVEVEGGVDLRPMSERTEREAQVLAVGPSGKEAVIKLEPGASDASILEVARAALGFSFEAVSAPVLRRVNATTVVIRVGEAGVLEVDKIHG